MERCRRCDGTGSMGIKCDDKLVYTTCIYCGGTGMENKNILRKTIDIVLIIAIILCLFALINKCDKEMKRRSIPYSLTKAEQKYILSELNKRNVGDCIVEPYESGWKCTDAEGRIYVIKNKKESENEGYI